MGAQVGGFDITMSGDGETLCLEWVRGYFILWNLYQFEKYEKNVGKICNPFELLFWMREKYISKHSSIGNSSSSLSWWL
jgi:hypothetical protein